MIKIEVYQCSFCSYYKKTKKSVANHEDNCFYNPKNKACASCRHNVVEYQTVYNPYHGGDPGSTDYEVKSYWCEKKNVELKKGTLCSNCDLWEFKEKENE